MKNALDWVADSGDLVDKPIALINASARARHTWGSLSETSAVMAGHVILEAWITVPPTPENRVHTAPAGTPTFQPR
jgi:chromate reductase